MTLSRACIYACKACLHCLCPFCTYPCTAMPKCVDVYMLSTSCHITKMQALFQTAGPLQVPGLQLGPAAPFANDSQLFFPVAALLESSVPEQSKAALQVLLCVTVAASMPHLHHSLSSLSACSCNVSKHASLACLWPVHTAVQLCVGGLTMYIASRPVFEASAVTSKPCF